MQLKQWKENYARLIIEAAIGIYPGQCLVINTGIAHYSFAVLLAEKAYQAGARYVHINAGSNHLLKARLDYADESTLDYLPHYLGTKDQEMLAADWAMIRIDNTEELDVLKSIDADRLDVVNKTARITHQLLRNGAMKNMLVWNVIAVPGPNWAAKVLGIEPSAEAEALLWEKLAPILRLDQADPIKAWKEHGDSLMKRAGKLNDLKLDRLHFASQGTDLTVGLSDQSRWLGGVGKSMDGRIFFPNIPTEEVFTTPDLRRTSGKVRVNRPVKVMETLVENAWFEFKEGKVVNFGADQGYSVLEKYLNTDEGARFAGEIALVDSGSKIYQSGLLFNSILYDENALAHIALGAGYPDARFDGNELISPQIKKERGCNVSLVHTDFMIGADDTTVTGYTADDQAIIIMQSGQLKF